MGYATAHTFIHASPNYHVLLGCRSASKAATALSTLQATQPQGTLSTLSLDVTDDASIARAVQQVSEHHGRLDVLINNAAVGGSKGPDVRTRYENVLRTNVLGVRMVAEYFRPLMLQAEMPRSVYVSSGAGSFGRAPDMRGKPAPPNPDAYMVSKAAENMVGMVDWLQNAEKIDRGEKGIKVYVMSPGFVVSNLRGESEEERTGWGKAGDPLTSGQCLLDIVEGRRDGDMGKLICKEGTYPW